jgi:hypothetical protein
LRKRLLEYVRDYDRYLVGLEDAGSANAKGARMAKSDSAEDFGNSPLVTLHLNPETGRMENAFLFRGEDGKHYFKEQKDIDKAYRSQKEQVRNMVRSEGNRKVTPGSSGFGIREDDAGRTFVGGPVLPKSFDSLIRVPEHLRNFARALEQGRDEGKSWIIQNHFVGSSDGGSYKLSRVRASGRTIPREAVFIDWKVTGADNILGVFFDLDAFRAATMKAINGSELELFNNSMDTVQEKLMQYLGNHRNGRGGATGLDADPSVATAMRDTLNGLIGTGTAVQRAANPFLSGLNPRGSVRTFRLDRIDDIKPSGRTGIHFDYDKVKGNKMPNTNNRMPQQIPREARGMPDVAASGRGNGMPDRKSLQQRAKNLGLPATGTTKEIARMVGIGEKSPYEWTREEFNEIAPHLSIHQDMRPGSDARAQQIMERGLPSGMVDSVGAWGRNHTWAGGKMAGDNAYLFVSSKLKYRPGNLNPWLDEGNIPIARIKTKPGQTDIYEALIASRPQDTSSAAPRGQAMPDSLESVPTDQLLRQYEENQGYLGLSTLGMREGRPVRGGAAQTRELLRRNEAISAELERRGVREEDPQLQRALQRRGQAMPDAAPADRSLVPAQPSTVATYAPSDRLPPNTALVNLVNNDGQVTALVGLPYDGTQEGLVRAQAQLDEKIASRYEWRKQYTKSMSQRGGTDAEGNPAFVVSANLKSVAAVGTPEARYILGDLSAEPDTAPKALPKPKQANTSSQEPAGMKLDDINRELDNFMMADKKLSAKDAARNRALLAEVEKRAGKGMTRLPPMPEFYGPRKELPR